VTALDPRVRAVREVPAAAPIDDDVIVAEPVDLVRGPLRLVDPRAWRSRRRMRVLGALLALVVVVAPFAIVALHVMMAQQQFQLDQLQAREEQQQRRYSELREIVARESSGPRLVAVAQQLGLTMPSAITQVTVPHDAAPHHEDSGATNTLKATYAETTKSSVAGSP
jgi:cell division protein FtsL